MLLFFPHKVPTVLFFKHLHPSASTFSLILTMFCRNYSIVCHSLCLQIKGGSQQIMALTKWLLINQDLVVLNEKDDLEVEELMEEERSSAFNGQEKHEHHTRVRRK